MESTNNRSFIPLGVGNAYIGTFDSVATYTSAVISLFSDQPCLITLYQSQNKTTEYTTAYTSSASAQFTQTVNLTAPFCYFVVRNQGSSAQTVLNFTVIYNSNYSITGGGGPTTNVNISDSNGNALNSTSGALNTYLTNTSPIAVSFTPSGTQNVTITSQSANLALDSTLQAIKAAMNTTISGNIQNGAIGAGGLTAIVDNATSNKPTRTLSIFGSSDVSTTLTVGQSIDGSTFYGTQYSINVVGGQTFGFCVSLPFIYLIVSSSSACSNLVINYVAV